MSAVCFIFLISCSFADGDFLDCGNTLVGGAVSTTNADCNMGCAGNTAYVHKPVYFITLLTALYLHSEACGGPNRVSVYSSAPVVVLPVPFAQKTNLPGDWTYAGCLREPATGKMFPNQIIWIGNNSAVACMNQCAAFGYPASGVEVSYKVCHGTRN